MRRQHFKISRASEYFEESELVKRTGMGREWWTEALLKELMDNALDITDSVEDPGIEIRVTKETLSVWDNGEGMSADLITKILDFGARVSDKFAYQGPTRGQQGNAFKTFMGVAHNMGGHVEIESHDLKHIIHCEDNPAGDIDVDHQVEECLCTGTKITVHGDMDTNQYKWAFNYHLCNPFVQIRYFSTYGDDDLAGKDEDSKPVVLYKSGSLDKIKVNDPTSPHWYSEKKFKALTYLSAEENVPAGQFIGQFHGLKTSKKKKAVAGGLDMQGINNNSAEVLARMIGESRQIKPGKLGLIGENTLNEILEPKRHWFRKTCGVHDGKPWAFEIMVAECHEKGLLSAVNHSITFEQFHSGKLKNGWLYEWGFESAAHSVGARFVFVHFIGISPQFKSLGKDAISFPDEIIAAIAKQTRLALTTLHKEKKQLERATNFVANYVENTEKEMPLTEAVPLILEEAMAQASESGQYDYSFRDLYYAARKLVQAHTSREMSQSNFSNIADTHWQGNRPKDCLYDPRGFLYEPHTKKEVPLGTLGVREYYMPEHRYNKVLYVEKKGVLTAIKQAGLPEKYDMAIMASEGFSTVAAREVMRMAQDKAFTIFVFHDADPAGYEIARTVETATETLPAEIEIIDIGLDIQTCVDMDLMSELFTRKKALPSKQNFTEIELEFFMGNHGTYYKDGKEKNKWTDCRRFEINALLPGDRVRYLDRVISEHNNGKVIPPADIQRKKGMEAFNAELDQLAEDHFAKKIAKVQAGLRKKYQLSEGDLRVKEYLDKNIHEKWETAIADNVSGLVAESKTEIKESIASISE